MVKPVKPQPHKMVKHFKLEPHKMVKHFTPIADEFVWMCLTILWDGLTVLKLSWRKGIWDIIKHLRMSFLSNR